MVMFAVVLFPRAAAAAFAMAAALAEVKSSVTVTCMYAKSSESISLSLPELDCLLKVTVTSFTGIVLANIFSSSICRKTVY